MNHVPKSEMLWGEKRNNTSTDYTEAVWSLPVTVSAVQKLLGKLFLKITPKSLTKAPILHANTENQGWEKRRKVRFTQAY